MRVRNSEMNIQFRITRISLTPKFLVLTALIWLPPGHALSPTVGAAPGSFSDQAQVSPATQATNPFVEMLKSPNPDTRAKAARQLGKNGDRSVVPALSSALTDPSV